MWGHVLASLHTMCVIYIFFLLGLEICAVLHFFDRFRNPPGKEKGRGNPSPEQKSLRMTTPADRRTFTARMRPMIASAWTCRVWRKNPRTLLTKTKRRSLKSATWKWMKKRKGRRKGRRAKPERRRRRRRKRLTKGKASKWRRVPRKRMGRRRKAKRR